MDQSAVRFFITALVHDNPTVAWDFARLDTMERGLLTQKLLDISPRCVRTFGTIAHEVVLPPAVEVLTDLEQLVIEQVHIRAFPDTLWQLPNLRKLALINLLDTPFPQGIQSSQLVWLSIVQGLAKFPLEITRLRQLRHLSLEGVQDTTLPSTIAQLSALESLSISRSHLKNLPAEIGALSRLKELTLSHVPIHKLPSTITHLKNLEQLYCHILPLETLPQQIQHWTQLKVLHLPYTFIKELPAGIGTLAHLESLNVQGCQLTTLPLEIGQLHNLAVLDVSHNMITELPPELGSLRNLHYLLLGHNPLETLPETFQHLDQLVCLDLTGTNISINENLKQHSWAPKHILPAILR